MNGTVEKIRRSFKEGDDIRDAGLTTPEDVVRADDLRYADDDPCQLLDVYRPKAAEGKRLPVIVSVHGGGWVYGDKERYQYYCMSLAQRGFAVVNFTYRLAPEHKWPCALDDTNAVFCWVQAHADEYGLDLDNLFAVGDSAGAHILGIYACVLTNPAYAARFSFRTPDCRLRAVGLNCGVYRVSLSPTPANLITTLLMRGVLPAGKRKEQEREMSVLEHVGPDFPPAYIMTANGDFLREQAPLLAAKLTECGVPFVSRCWGDEAHLLQHVFHCDMRLAEAAACNDEECAFFREQMTQQDR